MEVVFPDFNMGTYHLTAQYTQDMPTGFANSTLLLHSEQVFSLLENSFLTSKANAVDEYNEIFKAGSMVKWFRALDLKSGGPWFKS